jgi:hypothetical protein
MRSSCGPEQTRPNSSGRPLRSSRCRCSRAGRPGCSRVSEAYVPGKYLLVFEIVDLEARDRYFPAESGRRRDRSFRRAEPAGGRGLGTAECFEGRERHRNRLRRGRRVTPPPQGACWPKRSPAPARAVRPRSRVGMATCISAPMGTHEHSTAPYLQRTIPTHAGVQGTQGAVVGSYVEVRNLPGHHP